MNKIFEIMFFLILIGFNQKIFAIEKIPTTNFFISANGQDTGTGSITSPVRSVAKIIDILRSRTSTLSGNVIVNFSPGDFPIYSQINLNVTFTNNVNLVFQATNGINTTWITGARAVLGWVPYSGSVFRTQIGIGRTVESIYQGDKRAIRARFPNTTTRGLAVGQAGGTTQKILNLTGWNLPLLQNPMKARVLLWTKDAWWSKRFTVASQNTTASTLTLTQAPAQIDSIYSLTANQKAFVENDLALLDTPGEFYYDTTSGFLYYSPIGGIIPRTGIWVAETPTLLSISNMRNITFKNMGFRYTAMDISGDLNMNANGVSAKGAIDFWQGTNIKFDKCRFQSLGSQGISISNSSEVSIVNSKFHSIGFSAVKINGGMLSRNRTAKKNSVLSSRVYNSGEEYTSFAAIDIFNSSENKISHNHVLGNPGRCMNINSQPFSSMPSIIEGIPVTHTNQWDFNPTENNEISYNLVETCMKEASDGGGIYSGGAGRGNKFLYNVVRNVGNTLHDRVLINLIYLDDGTSYSEVFGNIAYGIIVPTSNINNPYKASYSMNSKGISNVIENNIFDYTGGFGGFYNWNMIPIDQSHDLTIKKNIFITNGPQNTVYDFVDWQDDRIEEADFNLIWHASNSVVRRWRGGKPNISNSSFSTNCTLNMNPGWSLNMSSCTTNTGPIVFDTHSIISSTYPFQGSYFPGNVEFSTSSNIPTLLGFEPLSLNQAADLTGNPYLN